MTFGCIKRRTRNLYIATAVWQKYGVMMSKIMNFINSLQMIRTIDDNGRFKGSFVRNGRKIFYLSLRYPNHYFRKYQGFGIDTDIINMIFEEERNQKKMLGIDNFNIDILIFYNGRKQRKILKASPDEFVESDISVHYEDEFFDHKKQKILPESEMECIMEERI